MTPLRTLLIAAGLIVGQSAAYCEDVTVIAPPLHDEAPSDSRMEKAVLAGGCFWGVQAVFQHVEGVARVVSGYAGGSAATALYEIVGTGTTGHAEAVEITFDPAQVTYGSLLQIFFSVAHDPTEVNRQGPDSGPQYRSAIVPTSPSQQRVAQAYIDQLTASRVFKSAIATRIEDKAAFYPAEDYHQDFLARHPLHPYIVRFDLPKIAQLKRLFPQRYREMPVLLTPAAPS
jgi:peptide-methionine (S)-S-oxide reductase